MVYPRGSRSFARFVTVCAVNLLVSHTAGAAGSCDLTVSPGDAAVGIRIVSDSSCASGGLGCINNECRFCKVENTPQSGHLNECSIYGYVETTPAPVPAPVPAPAPVPVSLSPCGIADGDLAVGINAITDISCADGGLGCYNDHCRFCKAWETPQSQHLSSCPNAPRTLPPPPSQPVETPCGVSEGDFAVGITAIQDPTCSVGGLGCYNDHCRFCRFETTPQSAHLNECPPPPQAPTPAPVTETPSPSVIVIDTPGEEPQPIIIVPSPAEETPSPAEDTPAPSVVVIDTPGDEPQPIIIVPSPAEGTPSPAEDTPAPSVVVIDTPGEEPQPIIIVPSPAEETPSPAEETPSPAEDTPAPSVVVIDTPGDEPQPIIIVPSPAEETPSPAEGTPSPAEDTPAPSVVVIDTPGEAPQPIIIVPSPAEETPAPVPVVPSTCPLSVSEGDYAVGIQLVSDPTCVSGGLGCFQEVCRFCKFRDSPQSEHLYDCADFGYNFTPVDETPAPVVVVIPSPADDTPAPVAPTPADDIPEPSVVIIETPGEEPQPVIIVPSPAEETPAPAEDTPAPSLIVIDTPGEAPQPILIVPSPVDDTPTPAEETPSPAEDTPEPSVVVIETPGEEPQPVIIVPSPAEETPAPAEDTPAPSLIVIDTPGEAPQPILIVPSPVDDTPAPAEETPSPAEDTPEPSVVVIETPGEEPQPVIIVPSPAEETPAPAEDTPAPSLIVIDTPGEAPQPILIVPSPVDDTPTPAEETPSPADDTPEPIVVVVPSPGEGESSGFVPIPAPIDDIPIADPSEVDNGNDVQCPHQVSPGDYAVGIQLVTDASCVQGGLGCFADICRFCRFAITAQSAHLVSCEDLGYYFVPENPIIPGPVPAPVPAPVDTVNPSIPLTCTQTVSDGDKAVGIDIATDISCVEGGLGCLPDSACRLCKAWDTPQSQHLLACADIPATSNGGDISFIPIPDESTPSQPPAVGGCADLVTEGDQAVGVSAYDDSSCQDGGLGCFASVCRFCKLWDTPQSSNFYICDGTPAPVAQLKAAAKEETVSFSAEVENVFGKGSFKWAVVSAGCVGALAVIALLVLGVKRITKRTEANEEEVSEDEKNDETSEPTESAESSVEVTEEVLTANV